MKKVLIILVCCIFVVVCSLVIHNALKPNDRPLTYEIGNVKKNISKLKNNYKNTLNKNEGYWVMCDGCQIHYRTDGVGKAILVIHGGPGEPYKKPWEGLKLINQKYSFVYYDQRGCGKSTRCVNKFDSNNWSLCQPELYNKLGIEPALRDIEEIRKIIGIDKITLIGHSYGGVIAALYAIEFPENVDKLILVSPAPSIRFPIESNLDLYKIIEKELSEKTKKEFEIYQKDEWDFSKIIKKSEKELSNQNSYFFHFYDEYHKNIGLSNSVSLIDNLVDKENIGGWLSYAYALSFPKHFDYRKNLRSIKAQTLIIWTDKDICQKEGIEEYSINIPESKTIQIKNGGHFVYEENPSEFSKVILDFLKN
ncbi:MAG: alpha/beta hydrolase [Bacillota bacterium]|nr:alpha/beta hydrolase [Bacillota bacterium]